MKTQKPIDAVEEIQGLYGPFTLSERVLQKLWLKGDFNQSDLRTASGRALRVLDPGRWNLLEGPDFLEARLELDGESVVGDVEVHFYTADWHLHGHGTNPNFADVRLHVVLYPDTRAGVPVRTLTGAQPECLCLLPLLERDLEEYALDDALLELEQVEETEWMRRFLERPLEERRSILRAGAAARWARKVDFARKRLAGAGWQAACHQYCLEVLGYARNRSPMARIALEHPLEDFVTGKADPDALFADAQGHWRLSGLRPSNHPRHRLVQYAAICQARPDWPEHLQSLLSGLVAGDIEGTGAAFRKVSGLTELAGQIADEVFSGKLSAKRLNTLICDALLPLVEAAGGVAAEAYWQHWPAGDAPERLHAFLKQAQIIDRSEPFSNGQLQGALQLLLQG